MLKRNDEKSAEYFAPTPTTSEDLSVENHEHEVFFLIFLINKL